jgi:hypothetical protein
MTARAFMVRGLLAGLVAGFAAFLVAYAVGEPHVDTAISIEQSGAHGDEIAGGHTHSPGEGQGTEADGHTHPHGERQGTEVSRGNQRTWGLLTGTLAVGVALGGLVALGSAGVLGRLGRLQPGQSTAVVSLVGFVAFALVPFLKYPANPPAVGSAATIDSRTALYFGFVAVSLAAAVVAMYATLKLRERIGTYCGLIAGAAGYLVVMVVAGQVFATVDEVGDFPGDTLWFFRRAALFTLATMWGVLGVVLTGLVGRLAAAQAVDAHRREFAASL